MQSQFLQFPLNINADKYTDELLEIKSLSTALSHIPLNKDQKLRIFYQEVLKSSLFSARIEGNQLTLADTKNLDLNDPKERSSLEISNVLKALKNLSQISQEFKMTDLIMVHSQVMNKLHKSAGKLRTESGAIFDGFGNIVYLSPEPVNTKKMLKVLFGQIQQQNNLDLFQQLVLIAQCHYYLEKIHPFVDGNGRVGRILIQHQIKFSLNLDYFLPIEEYFETFRSEYYFHLEKNTRHIEGFIYFFIKGIIWSLEKLLDDIKNIDHRPLSIDHQPQGLLPRRQEIFNIIQDHPNCSLDFISRRFPTIPKRTISYDIQQLVKKNLVTKHGDTKGVRYSIPA